MSKLLNPSDSTKTHLIRPSDTSEQYALSQHLAPLRLWVNLTHESTYIHGPFEFATMRGRRSRDRISPEDWSVLRQRRSLYDNEPPNLDLPTFSIHIDRGIHVSYHSAPICKSIRCVIARAKTSNEQLFR